MADVDCTNPSHYKRLDPEPITVIERWGLSFCLGNALKYIARAGHKSGVDGAEDLAKALWYVERELKQAGGDASTDTDVALRAEIIDELEASKRDAAQWKVIARQLHAQLVERGAQPVIGT